MSEWVRQTLGVMMAETVKDSVRAAEVLHRPYRAGTAGRVALVHAGQVKLVATYRVEEDAVEVQVNGGETQRLELEVGAKWEAKLDVLRRQVRAAARTTVVA